ncbi:MAG: hypothetical protein LUO88_03070 [Methanoregulaceae archaeon]|nr:hypothetical protein [Methanoregulaceae archaeon]
MGSSDQSQTQATTTSGSGSSQDSKQLASEVAQKEQELAQARSQLPSSDQTTQAHHDDVTLAAFTLQSASTVVPAHSTELDQIATQLQSSLSTESQAETQINQRTGIVRILIGGDRAAANQVETVANSYDDMITQLQNIADSPDVSTGARVILQDQITRLTAEHERLHALADSEKMDTGIFGGFLGG